MTLHIFPQALIAERTEIVSDGDNYIGSFSLISVPKLILKGGCQINAGAVIAGRKSVTLGKHVCISYHAVVLSSSDTLAEKMNDLSLESERRIIEFDMEIGEHAYIGSSAVVMPRPFIPEGVVLGALSYVPTDTALTPWTFYHGRPVQPIRSRPHT